MKPQVGVIMGSVSDWETMKYACESLEQLEIPYEKESFPPTVRRICYLNMQRVQKSETLK